MQGLIPMVPPVLMGLKTSVVSEIYLKPFLVGPGEVGRREVEEDRIYKFL